MSFLTETTYGKSNHINISNVAKVIEKDYVTQSSSIVASKHPSVYTIHIDADHIDNFIYPIVIKDKAFVDTRSLMQRQGVVRDISTESFLLTMASLELAWTNNRNRFDYLHPLTTCVFAEWLGSFISQRYNKDVEDRNVIKAALGIYYISLLFGDADDTNKGFFNGDYDLMLSKQVAKYLSIPHVDVMSYCFDESNNPIGPVLANKITSRLDSVTKWINDAVKVAMPGLDSALELRLLAVGSNAWVGNNSKAYISILLERPPLLAAIMHRATISSFYDKTGIGRTMKFTRRTVNPTEVNKLINKIIESNYGH